MLSDLVRKMNTLSKLLLLYEQGMHRSQCNHSHCKDKHRVHQEMKDRVSGHRTIKESVRNSATEAVKPSCL
jgi:hypothetical protein